MLPPRAHSSHSPRHQSSGTTCSTDHSAPILPCKQEKILKQEGLQFNAWRQVPVDEAVVGKFAKATEPYIEQVMIGANGATGDDFERKLYIARKLIEKARSRTCQRRLLPISHLPLLLHTDSPQHGGPALPLLNPLPASPLLDRSRGWTRTSRTCTSAQCLAA